MRSCRSDLPFPPWLSGDLAVKLRDGYFYCLIWEGWCQMRCENFCFRPSPPGVIKIDGYFAGFKMEGEKCWCLKILFLAKLCKFQSRSCGISRSRYRFSRIKSLSSSAFVGHPFLSIYHNLSISCEVSSHYFGDGHEVIPGFWVGRGWLAWHWRKWNCTLHKKSIFCESTETPQSIIWDEVIGHGIDWDVGLKILAENSESWPMFEAKSSNEDVAKLGLKSE